MEFEKLQAIIADVLNVPKDDITPETTFVDDLGADSLDIFQIIMGIEEEFDIEIDNEEAEKITTVQDAVEQIKKAVEYSHVSWSILPRILLEVPQKDIRWRSVPVLHLPKIQDAHCICIFPDAFHSYKNYAS